MLISDFTATGGVLGVALVDVVQPVVTPDLPQPPSELLADQSATMTSFIGPDLPQPPPN